MWTKVHQVTQETKKLGPRRCIVHRSLLQIRQTHPTEMRAHADTLTLRPFIQSPVRPLPHIASSFLE